MKKCTSFLQESLDAHTIATTEQILQLENLIRIAVSKHNKIYLTGLGKNVSLCQKIYETAISLGLPFGYLNAVHSMHGDLGILKSGDLVIGVSKSGTTSELSLMMSYTKKHFTDITLVQIHMNDDAKSIEQINTHSHYQVQLPITRELDITGLAPTTSALMFQMLLDSIVVTIAQEFGHNLQSFKLTHPGGAIGQTKQ
jgi:arabinose-5-phosphate isomerase